MNLTRDAGALVFLGLTELINLLDSREAVCGFTASMAWKGAHPVVELVTTTYQTGVTLTKEAMAAVEAQITRLPRLGKWFIDIPAPSPEVWEM